MKRTVALVLIFLAGLSALASEGRSPPPEVEQNYGFARLDTSSMLALLEQGNLVIVRQDEDLSLINVTSGQIVDAPVEVVWNTITDYDNYPAFMPQTSEAEVLEQIDENKLVMRQVIGVKIWRLPTFDIEYQLVQSMEPPYKVRFWHLTGELEGTYGGWDIVPLGDRTMIFYTLYSNLTALGWGLGKLFESEPDFMIAINTATAIVISRTMKKECERRAAQ